MRTPPSSGIKKGMALLVCVNYIVLPNNNTHASKEFTKYLHDCFNIKDIGNPKHFPGMEIAQG